MKAFLKSHKDALLLTLRVAIAAGLFAFALINYNHLTNIDVRGIVSNASGTAAAVASVLAIYLVKSLLFVIPASLIYIYVGMAFSPIEAILINLFGLVIELCATYFLGRFLGGDYVENFLKSKKGGEKILNVKQKNKLSAIFAIRALPVFPIDFVSLFLGSAKFKFLPYIIISVTGIMPRIILFTVLGDGIYDYIPMKAIVLAIICLIPVFAVFQIIKYFKKQKGEGSEKPSRKSRASAD